MVGLATVFGAGGGTSSYKEVEDTDVIVLWGSNARFAHPIFFHHVLTGIRKGAKLFVVDPRRTASARWADRWLGLHVGSDIALAHAIGREIIAAGLHNRAFVEGSTTGFDEYRAAVEPWTLERGRAASPACRPTQFRNWRTPSPEPIEPRCAGHLGSLNTTTASTTCCR